MDNVTVYSLSFKTVLKQNISRFFISLIFICIRSYIYMYNELMVPTMYSFTVQHQSLKKPGGQLYNEGGVKSQNGWWRKLSKSGGCITLKFCIYSTIHKYNTFYFSINCIEKNVYIIQNPVVVNRPITPPPPLSDERRDLPLLFIAPGNVYN